MFHMFFYLKHKLETLGLVLTLFIMLRGWDSQKMPALPPFQHAAFRRLPPVQHHRKIRDKCHPKKVQKWFRLQVNHPAKFP
jgi:hypothetical protein